MYPYPFMMPPTPGGQTSWTPKEWEQFFKTIRKAENKGKDDKKKTEDGDWEIIRRPKKKPRVLSVCQAFFLFTATFPVVAPLYYFTVLGSWELMKFGLSNMIK